MMNSNLLIGLFCGGLAALVFAVTRDLSRLGGVYVNFTLVAMAVLSVIMVIKGLAKGEKLTLFDSKVERKNILIGVAILMVYLGLLPVAGFLPSSYLFYFAFNLYLSDDGFKARNIIQSVVLSGIVVTLFYLIFHHFLEVPLPTSMWSE